MICVKIFSNKNLKLFLNINNVRTLSHPSFIFLLDSREKTTLAYLSFDSNWQS
jgi:hypothetical protein